MQQVKLLGAGVIAVGMICAAKPAYAWDPAISCYGSKTKQTCIVYDYDEKKVDGIWDCVKNRNGTWSCKQARLVSEPEQVVPPELKETLIAKGPSSTRQHTPPPSGQKSGK